MRHVYQIRAQGEHHRGFDVTGMDAKPVLMRAEERIYIAAIGRGEGQAKPVDAIDQHAEPGAQVSRHHIHQADLAAVAVEQHHAFHPGGGHAFADLGPDADHGFRLEGQGAGKLRVFRAVPHGLGGQKQGGNIGGNMGQRMRYHAIDQRAVHLQWQVRTMLLGGSYR